MTSEADRQDKGPLTPPEKTDPSWRKKIKQAEEAGEMGRKQREGKPSSFRRAVGRTAS